MVIKEGKHSEKSEPVRILSIDPSLRGTGYGVIEKAGRHMTALEYGVIRNPPKRLPSGCLLEIFEILEAVIQKHQPNVCAVESVIYVQSYKTAITLGAARGAAILAVSRHGIPIFEYSPKRVKQAVVGHGGADKQQVGFMVRALLQLKETPQADAADALAIGLSHCQNMDRPTSALTLVQPI